MSIGSKVLVVHYEELKADVFGQITRILRFMNVPVNQKVIQCLADFPQKSLARSSTFKVTKDMLNKDIIPVFDAFIENMRAELVRHGHADIPLNLYDL